MTTTQHLQKWGNGAGIRLSKKIRQAAALDIGQPLEVALRKDGAIILRPVVTPGQKTLHKLLREVTPATVRGEFDWGGDVGAEQL